MTGLGHCARRQSAGAQSPTFSECRAVADLDRDVAATRVQFCPKRIGFVERDRVLGFIMRSEHVHRFTCREHATAHIALFTRMVSGAKNFFEHLGPILHRLIIHVEDDVLMIAGPTPLLARANRIGQLLLSNSRTGQTRRAHLLALHVGSVTGNTHSEQCNEGCDDRFVSGGRARLPFSSGTAPMISPAE